MDDIRVVSNGVAKNGKEIIIVDDLPPSVTFANNKSNGHVANGFHPSCASSSLDDEDEDDTYDGQNGAKSSDGKEFLTESSVDEECDDDVSEADDDCAIVEEVSSVCNGGGRVAPSSCASMRPKTAEIRQEPEEPSPFSSPNTELPAPPPPQSRSNQKVLPAAATESVPNGQQNRRKQQRPTSSSSSSDSANKGRRVAVAVAEVPAAANHTKVQSVVKAPDCAEVCRSRSQDRQRGAPAPPPPAKLTRRANSGCNGLQSNENGGLGVRAVGVGAKSRSQSVDHERVRVERIPGECAAHQRSLVAKTSSFLRRGDCASDISFRR